MPLKPITRFIALAALFLVPIFPLIVANSFFFPFITGKAFYFRALVEIGFAAWVILAFLDARYRPKITPLAIGVTIFALVTLIADLLGVNPLRSIWSNFERMEGWLTIIHLWALFIMASAMFGSADEGKRNWHRWLTMSLAVATIVALYGIAQLLGTSQWLLEHAPGISSWFSTTFPIHQGSTRIDASLGNAAYMAVYMLFHAGLASYLFFARSFKPGNRAYLFPRWLYAVFSMTALSLLTDLASYWVMLTGFICIGILIFLYVRKPNLRPTAWQWLYAFLFGLFSFEVFATATRGTILGLIGGCMLALFLYAIFGKGELKVSRWVSGYIIIVIVFLGFVLWQNRPNEFTKHKNDTPLSFFDNFLYFDSFASFVNKNEVLNRLASISFNDSSTQARQYIWPMSLQGFIERPIYGWGQENFNYIFNAHYNPRMWAQEQWFDRAHNVFLDWLNAAGLVGLLSYLSLYVLFLVAVWKSRFGVAEKSVLTGLLAGYAIHNIFVFDNLASYILFFALLAFASSESHEVSHSSFGSKPASKDLAEYVVAPIALVALVAVFYFVEVLPIQANTRLIAALESCATKPDPQAYEYALSVNTYLGKQEAREQLYSCASSVINSQQMLLATKQAFYTLFKQEIQAQASSTPKDARLYSLAGIYMSSIAQPGATEVLLEAKTLLERAHELSPAKQSIDFDLADAYLSGGRTADAVALLKQAYESDTSNPRAQAAYAIGLVGTGKETEARKLFNNDPSIFETVQMARTFAAIKNYSQSIGILKRLLAQNPSDQSLNQLLVQVQYVAGLKGDAIASLRAMAEAHPELKDQVDATIKQIQKE